jgi:hypothetical protein
VPETRNRRNTDGKIKPDTNRGLSEFHKNLVHMYEWSRFIDASRNKGLGYPNFAQKRKFEEDHKQIFG